MVFINVYIYTSYGSLEEMPLTDAVYICASSHGCEATCKEQIIDRT